MDQEQSELRQIEDSRARVAGDVRSVAGSINVVQRTKDAIYDRVNRAKGAIQDRVDDAKDAVQGGIANVPPAIRRMRPLESPVAMLLGGIAVGVIAGTVLPKLRRR